MPPSRFQLGTRELFELMFWIAVAFATWRFTLDTPFPLLTIAIGVAALLVALATVARRTAPEAELTFSAIALYVGILPAAVSLLFVVLVAIEMLGRGGIRP